MGFLLNPYVLGAGGAYSLSAAPGALVLGGGAATLTPSQRVLAAAPGALVLGGGVATLTYSGNFSLSAAPGALVLGAGAATLTYSGASSPHRYWRIYVTDTDGGDGYTEIAEIEMAESTLGQNVCTGGTAIASSYFGGNTPDKAFDGSYSIDPGWIGSSASFPQWIGYDFGAGNDKDIQAVNITCPNSGYTGRSPKTFDVQWSDDGSSWTTAWSVSSSTGWSTNEFRRFNDPGASAPSYSGSPWGSHSYWRIHCAQPDGGTLSAGEIEFRATPGGSDQASGGSATASSEYGGGYEASKAFDNNGSTLWSAGPSDTERWIRYDFASAVSMGQVAITARNDLGSGASTPSVFAVQYADSTSGPWTTAWFVNGSTGWGIAETRTFTDPAYI